jgi:preprotein translocase subunit SecA
MTENVITFTNWKEKKQEWEENNSLQEYYQLLSFDQLIGESRELRKMITKGKNINALSLQTKLIFDEIQNRMISSSQKVDVQRLGDQVQTL